MKLTKLLVLFWIGISFWACEEGKENTRLEEARQRKADGDCEGAIALYDQILAEKPNELQAAEEAGECAYELGRFGEAIHYLGEAMDERRFDPDMQYLRSMAFLRKGNRKAGIRNLEKLLDRNPNRCDARIELAQISLQELDWEGFVKHLNACKAQASTDHRYKVLEAVKDAYLKPGPPEERFVQLEKLSTEVPEDTFVHYWEAVLRLEIGQPDQALKALEKLEKIGLQRPILRARALSQQGEYEKALEILTGLPDSPQQLEASIELHVQQGQPGLALDLLTLENTIGSVRNRNWEVLLEYMVKDPDSLDFYSIRPETPFNAGRRALRLYVIHLQGDKDASQYFEELLIEAPYEPLVYYFYGRHLLDKGDLKGACDNLNHARTLGLEQRYGPELGEKIATYCDR